MALGAIANIRIKFLSVPAEVKTFLYISLMVSGFSVSMFWDSSPSDLSKCNECKGVIYGTMFYFVVDMEEDGTIESTTFNVIPDIKYCHSCYSALGGKLLS